MHLDVTSVDDPRAAAVLLHPHPHYGGSRFHPFVDGLFRSLAGYGAGAVRFDFSSAELPAAQDEAMAAMTDAKKRWPDVPVVVVGYSFGAGVAAHVDDDAVAGWYLLAPPAAMLASAAIGSDARPKAIAVPAMDQYAAPEVVEAAVASWAATTLSVIDGADHFLGASVGRIVADAAEWISTVSPRHL